MDEKKLLAKAARFGAAFTTAELLGAMGLKEVSLGEHRRAGAILRDNGWRSKAERRGGAVTKTWRRAEPIISPAEQEKVERDVAEFRGRGTILDDRTDSEIAATMRKHGGQPSPKITVTISGPQGSGKTWLREVLEAAVKAAAGHGPAPSPDSVVIKEAQADTTSDAMDPETLLAATTEQLQRSVATGEGLVRQLAAEREANALLNDYAVSMTERWAAALCAGGIIAGSQIPVCAKEKIKPLADKVAAIRATSAPYEWQTIGLSGDVGIGILKRPY